MDTTMDLMDTSMIPLSLPQKTLPTPVSESHVLDCNPLLRKKMANNRLVNLALVCVKAAAGVLLHSSSLLADAGHSAADILSDILTLSTISFSAREPNLRYPLGYGKVETLGAIGVSSLLRILT
jgi:Co/Zn/Cd efflux system component